jgi:cytochrome P450
MVNEIKDLKGPKGLPIVGNMFSLKLNELHKQIENWADVYGDVFLLDTGLFKHMVVTRPSLINKISTERPDYFSRGKKLNDVLREGGVHGVFNAEGDEWRKHRVLIAKGLDVKHQQSFYPNLVDKVNRLKRKFDAAAETGEPYDIQKDLFRFTVDVTTDLAFGYDVNTLEQEGGVIQDHMEKIFPTIFKRINAPIPWHKLIRSKSDREFDLAVQEMNKLVRKFIQEGREKLKNNPQLKENPSNILESILVAAEEDEEVFTDETIRGNLLTLLMAGEDTTALTISWMIVLLAGRPDIVDQLRIELDNIMLNSQGIISEYKLNSELKYLEGCAYESLRFKPIAPIVLHTALQDIQLEEFEIKKDQVVLTQYRHGALSEKYFSDAKEFNPRRWLKGSGCPVHNSDASTPFGSGPRFCPGKNLAILEIKAVISMLYKNYYVEMITPFNEIEEVMAFTMMNTPYKVKLSKR